MCSFNVRTQNASSGTDRQRKSQERTGIECKISSLPYVSVVFCCAYFNPLCLDGVLRVFVASTVKRRILSVFYKIITELIIADSGELIQIASYF